MRDKSQAHYHLCEGVVSVSDKEIEHEILRQISCTYSVAPRDVAVAVAENDHDWRSYLPRIKLISFRLHGEGRLILVRKRKSITPDKLKGVYRLASPENFKVTTNDGSEQ